MMPRGSMLVNVGRGKHVNQADLIAALDSGQLSYAALDALWPAPLPPDNPLWEHPKVTIMPHVARRPTVAQLVTEIAASIRSPRAGGPAGRFCRKSASRRAIRRRAEIITPSGAERCGGTLVSGGWMLH